MKTKIYLLIGVLIYLSIVLLIIFDVYPIYCLAILLTAPLLIKLLNKIRDEKDWIFLDQYGHLIRKIYLINGIMIIAALTLN